MLSSYHRVKRARTRNPSQHWTESVESWINETVLPEDIAEELLIGDMIRGRRSTPSLLRRKRSDVDGGSPSGSPAPSDSASNTYQSPVFSKIFEQKGSFTNEYKGGDKDAILAKEQDFRKLLSLKKFEFTPPKDTGFDDDIFEGFLKDLGSRNEARIVQDIGRLLVPQAELMARRDPKRFGHLAESVDEQWAFCRPWMKSPPQPDYAVGMREEAFTQEQLQKMLLLGGSMGEVSFVRATPFVFFPFFTVESKRASAGLAVAENQNTHSMSVVITGIVEIFKLVGRESELNGRWLGLQVNHDNLHVVIYANYPVTTAGKTVIYRELIEEIRLDKRSGSDKWLSYGMTLAIYDHSRTILSLICSALDQWSPIPPPLASSGLSYSLASSGLSQALQDNALSEGVPSEVDDDKEQEREGSKKMRLVQRSL